METKKFTIVDTRTNSVKTIESLATTVGELKADLLANGIDVTGMAIQEGLTKTEYGTNDEALLPHDVPYRGATTNNLVFRITQRNKNIESGMDRVEAYQRIKDMGLAPVVKAKYGKNFTTVKTDDLISVIEDAETAALREAEETRPSNPATCQAITPIKEAFLELLKELFDTDCLDHHNYNRIRSMIEHPEEGDFDSKFYSSDEINDMFKNM